MKPVTTINTLAVKPGKIEEFVRIHEKFSHSFSNRCEGLIGGRLYRGKDGKTVTLISEFESEQAQQRIRNHPEVLENIRQLAVLTESSSPSLNETAHSYGSFS